MRWERPRIFLFIFLFFDERRRDFTVYGGRDERQNEKEDRYQSRQPSYPQVLASFESGNLKQQQFKMVRIYIILIYFF